MINKSQPFYFPDLQNGYSFCKSSKINVPEKANVGMIYIPSKEYYNIDSIEFALNHLFTTGMSNPYWIEQTAWAHMFYEDGRYIKLNEEKYYIPNSYEPLNDNVEALHLCGWPGKLYYNFLKNVQ